MGIYFSHPSNLSLIRCCADVRKPNKAYVDESSEYRAYLLINEERRLYEQQQIRKEMEYKAKHKVVDADQSHIYDATFDVYADRLHS